MSINLIKQLERKDNEQIQNLSINTLKLILNINYEIYNNNLISMEESDSNEELSDSE